MLETSYEQFNTERFNTKMIFHRPQQKEMKLWEIDQKKKLRVVWRRDNKKDE